MNKEEFINSNMKLSKEDIIEDYYKTEEKLVKYLGIEHENYELQEENKQLKEIIKENTILVKDEYGDYQECNINPLEMKQKYEKQVDNWNKLKEWLDSEIENQKHTTHWEIKRKMQELEQRSESDE